MDELEADIRVLLDSLVLFQEDVSQCCQTLKTLSEICSQGEGARAFSTCHAVKPVLEVFLSSRNKEIQRNALFTLANAVELYEPSKKLLCLPRLFSKMNELLLSALNEDSCRKHAATASYFIMCITQHYGPAQDVARESGCISSLIKLYRKSAIQLKRTSQNWLEFPNDLNSSFVNTVASALLSIVSQPLNATNQEICRETIPVSVSLATDGGDTLLKLAALRLTIGCLEKNEKCQRSLLLLGGIEALCQFANTALFSSETDSRLKLSLISCLSCAIEGNEKAKSIINRAGFISCLVDRLKEYETTDKEQVYASLMCLSHCIEDSEHNQAAAIDAGATPIIIKLMSSVKEERLSRVGLYVLGCCNNFQRGALKDISNGSRAAIKKNGIGKKLSKSIGQKNIERVQEVLGGEKLSSIVDRRILRGQQHKPWLEEKPFDEIRGAVNVDNSTWTEQTNASLHVSEDEHASLSNMKREMEDMKGTLKVFQSMLVDQRTRQCASIQNSQSSISGSSGSSLGVQSRIYSERKSTDHYKRGNTSISRKKKPRKTEAPPAQRSAAQRHHKGSRVDCSPAFKIPTNRITNQNKNNGERNSTPAIRRKCRYSSPSRATQSIITCTTSVCNRRKGRGCPGSALDLPKSSYSLRSTRSMRSTRMGKTLLSGSNSSNQKLRTLPIALRAHQFKVRNERGASRESCNFQGNSCVAYSSSEETSSDSSPKINSCISPHVNNSANNFTKCLGCYPFSRFPFVVINSENCKSTLKNDPYTCKFHSEFLGGITMEESAASAVELTSISSQSNSSCECESTIDAFTFSEKSIGKCQNTLYQRSTKRERSSSRRKRKEYSESEIDNLKEGVKKYGQRWSWILHSYRFKAGRTAINLKDKYKQLRKKKDL